MDLTAWLAAGGGGGRFQVGDGGLARRRFTASRGWDTQARVLDEHLVYAVHRGQALVETGAGGLVVGPGRLCLIPPGVRFRVRAGSPPPQLTRLRLRAPRPMGSEAVVCDLTPELRRVLDLLADPSDVALGHEGAWAAVAAHLLAVALARAVDGRGPGALSDGLLSRCQALVEGDPRITPRALAQACGLSHDWFTRAFRAAAGRPPRAWLVEARVRLAAQRLTASPAPAGDVARSLGWNDARLFGRQFRAVMGTPPGRWRRIAG